MKYMVLHNRNLSTLEYEVNNFLKLNWKIVGGMTIAIHQHHSSGLQEPEFYQTLIKEENNDKVSSN